MPPNPLKQRLAALSLKPPTFPFSDEPSPSSPRRKTAFNPPWVKRNHAPLPDGANQSEMVQEVMARMIFQAGVDFETRPMVVLNACALPDPDHVSYDLLLSRILSYLNLYVEADYTVVFFAAGGRHTPGWNWVWKAYRSLSRKYRKNLKQLYIVHSSFFTKMLFSLAGAIISPKFFRKLVYINTLSELAQHVPITQIDILPAVYQENLKHERKIALPTPGQSSMFGVPLAELMGEYGEKDVPRVVRDAIQFLRESGLDEEGLFRRSPQSAMLRAVQEAYDRGNVVSLDTFGDPHLAAVLLKKFLRDLPEPIFPEALYTSILRCPSVTGSGVDKEAGVRYVRTEVLPLLKPCAGVLLSHVLQLMHEVAQHASANRMDAHNLAVVLCPNLVKGSNPARDVMMCTVPGGPALFSPSQPQPPSPAQPSSPTPTTLGAVIKLCIEHYYDVFSEEPIEEDAPDPRARESWHTNDDEDIDDTMLVMPIGLGHRSAASIQRGASGRTGGEGGGGKGGAPALPPRP